MSRYRWTFGLAALLAIGGLFGFYVLGRRVGRPPAPPAAALPASARSLLLPFRKDSFDLTVEPHSELDYRVGMQAGATLVYAWSTGRGDTLAFEFRGQKIARAAEAHGAFEAQSSGWYHWRWKNQNGKPVIVNIKLHGSYETATIPAAGMPYDR